MSCTLYLLRHGIAANASAGVSDSDRALTAEGAEKMRQIAVGLKRLGIRPDGVLSSPLRRAQETAAVVAGGTDPALRIQIYPALAPGHSPQAVLAGLRAYRSVENLFLVGHQPDLGQLASYLLTGASDGVFLPFKKGGLAAIDVSTLPPRSAGTLQWFATPKMLRAAGRDGR